MSSRLHQIAIAFCALLFAGVPARGDAAATYTLGTPALVGSVAQYPLTLDFSTDAGQEVVFFSIGVSSSASALTSGGTDYTRFSFQKASPALDDWGQVPATGFGPSAGESFIEFDTIATPLGPGTHSLGVLSVDFAGSGLSTGDPTAVSLLNSDSVLGIQVVGQPVTFTFLPVAFVGPPVGPSTIVIDAIAPNESNFFLPSSAGGSASTTVAGSPANILGGERSVATSFVTSNPDDIQIAAKTSGSDLLTFTSSVHAIGTLELGYGLNSDLNANFLTGGLNAIIVDMEGVDGGGLLTVELTSGGATDSVSQLFNSPGDLNFFFSSYSGIDFGDIDKIRVTLTGTEAGSDFAIESIVAGTAVPEVGSIVLLAGGFGLCGVVRRRAAA